MLSDYTVGGWRPERQLVRPTARAAGFPHKASVRLYHQVGRLQRLTTLMSYGILPNQVSGFRSESVGDRDYPDGFVSEQIASCFQIPRHALIVEIYDRFLAAREASDRVGSN
jgi:hypothetical protein